MHAFSLRRRTLVLFSNPQNQPISAERIFERIAYNEKRDVSSS